MTSENAGAGGPATHGESAGGASSPAGSGADAPGATSGAAEDASSSERPDLAADLRALGENLREAFRAAWTSDERARLQSDIERGLASLSQALGRTFEEGARELSSRERLRERMEQARARVAGLRDELKGETRDRVRSEIHDLLTRLNDEVARSKNRWQRGSGRGEPRG